MSTRKRDLDGIRSSRVVKLEEGKGNSASSSALPLLSSRLISISPLDLVGLSTRLSCSHFAVGLSFVPVSEEITTRRP